VSRDRPGAVLDDPELIAARAVQMAGSGQVDSVCVHGDSPGAVAAATAVRRALEAAGIAVRARR
jgi:5-oxoprolinase (ATP-hydrolysing) subunit A